VGFPFFPGERVAGTGVFTIVDILQPVINGSMQARNMILKQLFVIGNSVYRLFVHILGAHRYRSDIPQI
jgi:hypothetical protein